jgi:phosphoribosyl 1,2-cyclic phosphodiesterase
VLDAGTGIRSLTPLLEDRPFRGSILLGHLHWDHTQGLPFFRSGNHPGAEVDLRGPAQLRPDGGVDDFGSVLSRAMSPPHFPIGPNQLQGKWSIEGIEEGDHEAEGFSVRALEIPHTGGRTFGYRISDGRSALAYLSDHYPLSLGPGDDGLGLRHPAALDLVDRADLVLHDAQYRDEELPERAYMGHSSPGYALGLARAGGARQLLLFHHDPDRTDAEVDAMLAALQQLAQVPAGPGDEHDRPEHDRPEQHRPGHDHPGPSREDSAAHPVRVGAAAQGDVIRLGAQV